MSVKGAYGLGLVARRTLSTDEEAKIGRLIRGELAAPFAHLLKVFNSVYSNATPDDAFAALSDQHAHSLRFHRAVDVSIPLPRPLVDNLDAGLLWVKDQLVSNGNGAYWKLFGEHMPLVVDKALKDEARELDRAA